MHTKLRPGVYLTVLAVVFVAACGTVEKRKARYKNSEPAPALEVPPDLLSIESTDELEEVVAPLGGVTTYSAYTSQGATRQETARVEVGLPPNDKVRLARDGAQHWLVLRGEPGLWWERFKEFWIGQGLAIKRELPEQGIIETDWSEDISQIKVKNFLRKTFDFLYDASTRDKFVMLVEASPDGSGTDVFIVHRGMKEEPSGESSVRWVPRESDPALEIELMKRLALFLGAEEGAAEQLAKDAEQGEDRVHLQSNDAGEIWLTLDYDFARAWRSTGVALSRHGLSIDDHDRSNGMYYVSGVMAKGLNAKKGFFQRIIEGVQRDDVEKVFQVKLESVDDKTRLYVLDVEKQRDNSEAAEMFLRQLSEHLK
jgi:outer membrane protein assembly factor BamC